MPIHRHVTRALGHACTIVACPRTHRALVVDPGRDIAPILDLVRRQGLQVEAVLDTHGHNDYLSGLEALAAATGARRIGYVGLATAWADHAPEHGEQFAVGDVEVEILHTPGHTPEHTALLVREPGAPAALVSGGSLLVGDVGRPDLLGGDAELRDNAQVLQRTILDLVLALDDDVRLYPTHVAGSLCAGAIGGEDDSTIGEQRRSNPAVRAMVDAREHGGAWLDEATLPPVPAYWRRMRGANVAGVGTDPAPQAPARIDAARAVDLQRSGAVLVDTRSIDEHATSHPVGALFVPAGNSFATWAGSVLDAGDELVLVAADEHAAVSAALDAWRIGLGPVVGWLAAVDVPGWSAAGGELATTGQVGIADVFEAEDVTMVDVRSPLEQRAAPVPGAVELPATLLTREPGLAPDGPLALLCASGTRSMVAAAVLRRAGRDDVVNVRGGIAAMRALA